MKLSGTGRGFGIQASSTACIKIHRGPHLASFWYRTSDARATEAILGVEWYVTAGCSFANAGFDELSVLSPVADGAWHEVTGTLTGPPATKSAFFFVGESCDSCTAVLTMNFDDLVFDNNRR